MRDGEDRGMSTNVIDALARVPLLSGLDRKQLEKLSRDFSERTFPAGSVVVKEGEERGIGFFVVADGEAVASVAGAEVSRLGPGSHFGEIALISDRVRTATVTAITDLHCYVMTLWDFRSFVQGDAEVAWKLLEQLASMLHRSPSAGR
jgi:CRP-like cAMP-binding protein